MCENPELFRRDPYTLRRGLRAAPATLPRRLPALPENRPLSPPVIMDIQQVAHEGIEALWNRLVNLDNAVTGVNEKVAGLQLQAITANLTHQHWLQTAALLPSPFSGTRTPNDFSTKLTNMLTIWQPTPPVNATCSPCCYRTGPPIGITDLPAATKANWAGLMQAFLQKYGPDGWIRLIVGFQPLMVISPTAKYGPDALNLLQESQLLDRQQGANEFVDTYSVDTLNRLHMTALPQAEKLKIYLKGLQPYYRVQVLEKGADTLETARP